jgi:hypothetical protein
MIEVRDGATGTTLSQFAGMTAEAVSAGLTKDVLSKAAKKDSAKLNSWAHTASADGAPGVIGQKLVGVLQDDMGLIFAGVWNDCRELKQAAEESKKSDEPSTVVLTEHEFSYEVNPEVDVYIGGVNLGGFKFVVKMICTVSALAVEVEKGEITSVRAGSCAGGAEITLAGTSVWKREFMHKELAGVLKLKEPVKLA